MYKADEPAGVMSIFIAKDDKNRLIARHATSNLHQSVQAVREGGFLHEFLDRLESVYRALGVHHIEIEASAPHETWTWFKADYQFNPEKMPENLARLIHGIKEMLQTPRVDLSDADRVELTSMLNHLEDLEREMPTVNQIAKISDRLEVGQSVLAEDGWHGIRNL